MDRRRAFTALGSALPGLIWTFLPTANIPPVWLVAIGLGAWAAYWVFVEPRLRPTTRELQHALDKMINYRFLSDGGDWQLRPIAGLSNEQMFLQHAPADYREDAYRRLGLPKPPPREPYR